MSEALTIKNLFGRDEVRNKFQEMLGKRAPGFITSVLQIVASNKYLASADPHSVYHTAAVAATLDLPLNNNLGFAYIVPYNESFKDSQGNWKKRQVAQFQMGYKGYIQLGQRSGLYKTINATDVREGELIGHNLLTGDAIFKWEQDEEKREALPIIGYVSYFELLNGFSKMKYMSKRKIEAHAKRYSQTYKTGKGKWFDDFDAMAMKTVLKLNISKFGPMSVDMQTAIKIDQATVVSYDHSTGAIDVTYADGTTPLEEAEKDEEEITVEQLQSLLDEKIAFLTKPEFDSAKRIIETKETDSYKKLFDLLTSKTE